MAELTIATMPINLIGLGSHTAILGVFNVTAIALDWSYCIPIGCRSLFGKFQPGPWNLDKAGPFVSAWACIWTFLVLLFFLCRLLGRLLRRM